ncbi:MAG: GNAT family N-acetyltransferase [Planctomycetota bacterium]
MSHIRPAVVSDAEMIADMNVRMARETEGLALDPPTVVEGVAAVLADRSKGHYLVAEAAGRVVGCLLVTHEWSDWRNGDLWWVQSVFVEPDHRGRGVFRSLYEATRQQALEESASGLRLYVEHENHTAQQTYRKLGMSKTHYHIMEEMLTSNG